jgi:hypothetical protein
MKEKTFILLIVLLQILLLTFAVYAGHKANLQRKYDFEDCLNRNPEIEGFDQFNYCWNKINP